MKNEDKAPGRARGRRRRSQITRQVLLEYVIVLAAFVAGFLLFLLMAWQICASVVWYPDDPLYQLLHLFRDYLPGWILIGVLTGWTVITYKFMERPLRYLDEVVAASEELASPKEEPIVLPGPMKNVQDELNLVREQALRSQMLAREAEQRKNDLIVYLAHDLKTPLTSVIGYLSLLKEEPDIPAKTRAKYTGIALDKAQRLEDLINEFFDITRFNLTTLILEPERTSLSRMLEQIASEFLPVLSEKELGWDLHIEPGVEMVCDPDKLERVFDNLVRNAVNYSYRRSKIYLSMKRCGEEAEICIINVGKTIPKEKLEHIFEQFFRLDSSRSSETGGAGLGLAIAKEIVELHRGTIEASSERESITFLVRLPLDCQKIV